jgi:hypothetical protein
MALRMVRFVPGVKRGGLGGDGHRQQQQNEQGTPEGLPTAHRSA